MKHDVSTRIPEPPHRRSRLLAALLAVAVALPLAARSEANQVYKACGGKWLKQTKKLQPEELAWMMEKRTAQVARDLDGDGAEDTVTMTNRPSFRSCDVRSSWSRKETTIRIEYGNGKTAVFYWIDGQLTETVKLYPTLGKLLVSGTDAGGRVVSRWVEYRTAEAPIPETRIAEIDDVARCPALVFAGTRDERQPDLELCRQIVRRSDARGKALSHGLGLEALE